MEDLLKDYELCLQNYRRLQTEYEKLLDGVTSGSIFTSEIVRIRRYLDSVNNMELQGVDFIDRAALLYDQESESIRMLEQENMSQERRIEELETDIREEKTIWAGITRDPRLHDFSQEFRNLSVVKAVAAFVQQCQEVDMLASEENQTLEHRCRELEKSSLALRTTVDKERQEFLERNQQLSSELERSCVESRLLEERLVSLEEARTSESSLLRKLETEIAQNNGKMAIMKREIQKLTATNNHLSARFEDLAQENSVLDNIYRRTETLRTLLEQNDAEIKTLSSIFIKIATLTSSIVAESQTELESRERWQDVCSTTVLVGLASDFQQRQSLQSISNELYRTRAHTRSRLDWGLNTIGQEISKLQNLVFK